MHFNELTKVLDEKSVESYPRKISIDYNNLPGGWGVLGAAFSAL